jgi:hypothetical protein
MTRMLPRNGALGRSFTAARRRAVWLSTWLQDRRRARQQPVAPSGPDAPTITSVSDAIWDATTPNWADLQVNFTFVHGASPVALIEMWLSLNSGAYVLLGTVASTATNYYHANACDLNGGDFNFKARYKNGGTLGPYSNVAHVYIGAI